MTTSNHPIKTRFAPSPTGLMHFGNVRTALFNYLYAKHLGGIFLLRIEDTDLLRSEVQFRDAILRDLKWLGLEWQEGPYFQSERKTVYDQYYDQLEKEGHVYPCFCTEEKLALTRKVQLSSGQPPRYPGTCKKLTALEVEKKKTEGTPYTLRFAVKEDQKVQFNDLIKGNQIFETNHIGDFIIRRQDNTASFMFCNAIDDALMQVTHALRGDDHLTNTPRQLLILEALKLKAPFYGHFPTILGPDSRPLSKRNGSRSIQELRETGFLPISINNYLARLGHYDPDPQLLELAILSQHFDLNHISHAPAHYDEGQLMHWQKEAMHQAPIEELMQKIQPSVKDWVPQDKILPFIETIRPNLVMPSDALPWAEAFFRESLMVKEKAEIGKVIQEAGPDFFVITLECLKVLEFSKVLSEIQAKTNRKGKALFFPIRAALTGELHGPELVKTMELMGMDKVKARLTAAANYAKNI